jgi:hypothetical protein
MINCWRKARANVTGMRFRPAICGISSKIQIMAKSKDPIKAAEEAAEKDMEKDPDLNDSESANDLDEGELAERDNSDEEALDALEKRRPTAHPHPHTHPGHHPGGHDHTAK